MPPALDAWLRRHPRTMLVTTLLLAVAAAIALLFVGQPQPILYQAF
jgi:hypothetical protein